MIHVYKERRPWGNFERFTKEVPSTVKIITVEHGQTTSLQYHAHRQEFWRVIEGHPLLTIGDKEIEAKPNNEFFIDKRVKHRITAGSANTIILEISLGHFDESDVVRLEDKYGRSHKAETNQIFKRFEGNPILSPVPTSKWENNAVFNPAAIRLDGVTHLLYRAMNEDRTSVIGHATTRDGLSILERDAEPCYMPRAHFEMKSKMGNSGCEDPRLTKIGNKIFMAYTAYCGDNYPRVAMSHTTVRDFVNKKYNWSKPVIVTPAHLNDKDACLFPERIDGKYYLFHRTHFAVCLDPISSLGDNASVSTMTPIFGPQGDAWESKKVGLSCPPLKTSKGWLTFYHGVDRSYVYRIGAVLLDLKDPHKVIARTKNFLFEPEMDYEKVGQVNNVVFPCGCVQEGDMIFIYYGAADSVIGVATASLSGIMKILSK